jgi:2-oxoglutarate ferredoxin oxidoreductase subunit alpha
MALGAAFAGHLGVTTTSGPGMALKAETISLAVSLELPLLIVDIQRGGPSTGLPTKTEAADLNIAVFGRPSEAPLPVVAASSPAGCFTAAIEAVRIAVKYRTPVILLSDGFLANGSEPWQLPDIESLPDISVPFATEKNHINDEGADEFWPYLRDPETLARPWAIPGTPGLMHRIGGIEKEDGSGNISYAPDNHQRMVELRAAKIAGIARDIPPSEVAGDVDDADLLVVSWGSTWAAVDSAIERRRRDGRKIAWVHLTHLNPLPSDLGDIVRRYPKVLVPELNSGQLARILRANYLVDAQSATKIKGLPFTARELEEAIQKELAR